MANSRGKTRHYGNNVKLTDTDRNISSVIRCIPYRLMLTFFRGAQLHTRKSRK